MPYTILIADDSALTRHSLKSCIEQSTDWRVCGEAENGKVAIEKVKKLHPDAVILDLQMPVMNGIEAARQIRLIAPNTAMLMFTVHTSEYLVVEARAVGIKAVISKSMGVADHLLPSLKRFLTHA